MSVQEVNLKAIADAIREKDGTTDAIKASNFAQRIRDIQSGGGDGFAVPLIVTVEEGATVTAVNGSTVITVVSGADGTALIMLTEPGQWTVSATKGELYASQTIIVNGTELALIFKIEWTAATMPSSANWRVTYGGSKFVAVAYGSNQSVYSTDGINWTTATMPSNANWYGVTYGNGKFVAVAYGSNKAAYTL